MALPTLDATFASSADLPRKQMLAKWLVEELGSGSVSDYWTFPERYLWAKIAVAAGAPKTESDYISLPKNYVWSDIYNAVAGSIPPSNVLVSGAGSSAVNGTYIYRGEENGKPYYNLVGEPDSTTTNAIVWTETAWLISDNFGGVYGSDGNTEFPWMAGEWYETNGDSPPPTFTEIPQPSPNHTDWSENVALGHIAAAYRGDTGNPANLATYINWPWRYKVAAIISHLATPESYNAVIVSGAGTSSVNGTYVFDDVGLYLDGQGNSVSYDGTNWNIYSSELEDDAYRSSSDTEFPWEETGWTLISGSNPVPTLTPTNV